MMDYYEYHYLVSDLVEFIKEENRQNEEANKSQNSSMPSTPKIPNVKIPNVKIPRM